MRVLAVDTATTQVSVAIGGSDGPVAALTVAEGRRHGELLAPAIAELTRLAGIPLAEIDLFAADVGPGLFTGLRVGLSTVAALAHGLGKPAVGITSTELLAAPHAQAARPVAAVVDIRRGEVAWSLWRGTIELVPPTVATPEQLVAGLREAEAGVLAVGDGAIRYADVLRAAGVDVAGPVHAHPSAAVLADVAPTREPGPLAPMYLRDADVRIGWDQAPARG